MKCVCGYKQEKDFDTVKTTVPIGEGVAKIIQYDGLYVCPECGTVKMKVEKEIKR